MTVRVTSLKGDDAGRYYVGEPGVGRYYLDPSEPAGQWHGNLALELGLAGEVDPEVFLALMAGHDPASGEPLERRYGEKSVRGYDVTFSAPKSVSLLWAVGDQPVRDDVIAAHDTAVDAVLGFVENQAHTRLTIHGQVMVVDASGLAVAAFRQHTSRTLDPQLHTHGIVITKVHGPNGAWLALDGRMVKCDQQTLSSLYHAGLRAELTRRLGVGWEPVESGIAEMTGIPEPVRNQFSQRTEQVDARLEVKLERFRETMGRDPTWKEQWRLEREAVTDSRPSKPHPTTARELHARWRGEVAATGVDPARLVADVVGRHVAAHDVDVDDARAMAGAGLRELIESRSWWRRNDVIRELARATPTTVTTSAGDLIADVERFADQLLGGMVELAPAPPLGTPRRRDGRPITESTLDRQYTIDLILTQEQHLVEWAEARWAQGRQPAALDADGLDRAQAVAAGASPVPPHW